MAALKATPKARLQQAFKLTATLPNLQPRALL
jgi:hypothetical protein